MLLPLVYYLVAFFAFVLLYEYYRNNIRKITEQLEFFNTLEKLQFNSLPTLSKRTYEQIKNEISAAFYFNRIRIIFGIDLSASNEWQGRKTFSGNSLHKTQANKIYNPYQKVISQLGPVFEELFAEKIEYSCFGFGDEHTKDFAFFPIVGTGEEFNNHQQILDAYLEQTKNVVLSGPTSFTPMIKKLISYGIHYKQDFTLLVILTDELKISYEDKTLVESIRNLTNFPNTSLIVIGVGDGPWQRMSFEEHRLRELVFKKYAAKKKVKYEDQVLKSKIPYDNFHFVDYNNYSNIKPEKNNVNKNYFARAVLAKLPTQLKQAILNDENKAHF